jgi:hypothetical protein
LHANFDFTFFKNDGLERQSFVKFLSIGLNLFFSRQGKSSFTQTDLTIIGISCGLLDGIKELNSTDNLNH